MIEDDYNFYLISELLEGGDLHNRLQKVKKFNEQQAATIIKQILMSVNFLHRQGIVHRDLKP